MPSKKFKYDNEPEVPFKEHQCYQEPGDTKLVSCLKCGETKLEVGSGDWFGVLRCPTCKHEEVLFDG